LCPQYSHSALLPALSSIVGYGTFITHGYWKDKLHVQVCLVNDFIRIFPKGNWFPYILHCIKSSFWALKFDVSKEELNELDRYEGDHAGLFKRIQISVFLNDKRKLNAFIYIPTDETINTLNLNPNIDKIDRWKEEIKKFPEVVKKFPELIL